MWMGVSYVHEFHQNTRKPFSNSKSSTFRPTQITIFQALISIISWNYINLSPNTDSSCKILLSSYPMYLRRLHPKLHLVSQKLFQFFPRDFVVERHHLHRNSEPAAYMMNQRIQAISYQANQVEILMDSIEVTTDPSFSKFGSTGLVLQRRTTSPLLLSKGKYIGFILLSLV